MCFYFRFCSYVAGNFAISSIVGLREVVFIDQALRRIAVTTRHDVIGHRFFRLDGLEGLFQFIDSHAELGIVHHAGLFIYIKVETLSVR